MRAGTIIISLFCAVGCLAWCGGVRNCPTSPKESFTRTPSEQLLARGSPRQGVRAVQSQPPPPPPHIQEIQPIQRVLSQPDSSDLVEARAVNFLKDRVLSLASLNKVFIHLAQRTGLKIKISKLFKTIMDSFSFLLK